MICKRIKNNWIKLLLLGGGIAYFGACSKTDSSTYSTAKAQNYQPIKLGNSWHYTLDSIVLTSFGTDTVVNTYEEMDSVVNVGFDLLNDSLFTIRRYVSTLNNSGVSNNDWNLVETYYYAYSSKGVEMVQTQDASVLRFIKLANPVSTGTSWDGNTYITKGSTGVSSDSILALYLDWNYTYTAVGSTIQMPAGSFANSAVISLVNDTVNAHSTSAAEYRSVLTANEIYAKSVGLIYQQFLYLVWQPTASGYEDGNYGIIRKLKSYNLK